jgi:nucleoside-diphosphate-sugar epimerase
MCSNGGSVGTVLVTGGAGYIGSMVSRELLSRGHEVVVADALLFGGESLLDLLSHTAFTFRKTDICAPPELAALFAEHRFDAVVHLASIVGDPACKAQPELATRTIWEASKCLFEHCEQHGVGRFVFASTCSNYGKMESDALLDEESPLRPVSLYAELKVRFEEYLLQRPTSVDFTILRFATVYGLSLRPRFDLTINEFTRDALLRGELEIFGPQFWRPYCHVRDIAGAVAFILESDRDLVARRTFNVGSNHENYQKRMIAEEVAAQVPVRLVYVERDEDPRDYRVCFDRISALGFVPKMRLPDGIREIAAALKNGLITDPYAAKYANS